LTVEDCITGVEKFNEYIPWMEPGATKFLEQELIRTVAMKKIPTRGARR